MIAIVTTLVFGLLAVAALGYGMCKADEAENMRQERDEADRRAATLSASIARHIYEGIAYQHEVNQLEQRNRWLEQHHRVVMLRWWKRRHYRTLSTWRVTGGVQ